MSYQIIEVHIPQNIPYVLRLTALCVATLHLLSRQTMHILT